MRFPHFEVHLEVPSSRLFLLYLVIFIFPWVFQVKSCMCEILTLLFLLFCYFRHLKELILIEKRNYSFHIFI